MKISFSLRSLIFIAVCFTATIYGQQVSIKPFSISRSDIIDDLRSAKKVNPNLNADELVKIANLLLEKQGLNFIFAFDSNTCQKIEQAKKNRKDQSAPLNLRAALKSSSGETASLLLPEAVFDKRNCSACYVSLPLLEITGKDFVTIIERKNLKFYLPPNFIINEMSLVDSKDLTTVKTNWKVPFRATPLSISDDGNILYLGFADSELKDIALMIYGEGTFQFCVRKEINFGKKGVLLDAFPKNANNPNLAFIKFIDGDTSQIVRFSKNCGD